MPSMRSDLVSHSSSDRLLLLGTSRPLNPTFATSVWDIDSAWQEARIPGSARFYRPEGGRLAVEIIPGCVVRAGARSAHKPRFAIRDRGTRDPRHPHFDLEKCALNAA